MTQGLARLVTFGFTGLNQRDVSEMKFEFDSNSRAALALQQVVYDH